LTFHVDPLGRPGGKVNIMVRKKLSGSNNRETERLRLLRSLIDPCKLADFCREWKDRLLPAKRTREEWDRLIVECVTALESTIWPTMRRMNPAGRPSIQPLPCFSSAYSHARGLAYDTTEADLQGLLNYTIEWCGVENSEATGKLSPRELADKHGVNLDALNKRLERWRYEHDAGYSEVTNSRRNEPKYLYDEMAVMPVIADLKNKKPATAKRPTNVQRKKI
jgi:hypothetical protein